VTERGRWRGELEPKIGDEVAYIVDAFAAPQNGGIDIGVVTAPDGGLGYLYAVGQLLVREQYLDRVLDILGQGTQQELRAERRRRLQQITPGVQLLRLAPTKDRRMYVVPDAVSLVDQQVGVGIATPDQVLTVAPTSGGCPATEPEPAVSLGLPRQRRRGSADLHGRYRTAGASGARSSLAGRSPAGQSRRSGLR
jgi:hypothetical protein